MQLNQPETTDDVSEIRLNSRLMWFIGVFAVIFAGMLLQQFIFEPETIADDLAGVIFVVILTIVFAIFTYYASRSYILIRPDGLLWKRGQEEFYFSWDEIRRLEKRGEGKNYMVGLRLYTPTIPKSKNFVLQLLYQNDPDFIPLSVFTDVPLKWHLIGSQEINIEKFRQMRVGAKIHEYAPHVLS